MRFLITIIFTLAILFSFSVSLVSADSVTCDPTSSEVCLLQPDIIKKSEGAKEASLGNYLSLLFKTLIVLAGGIAVLIIVVSGLQYILSEVPGIKSSSKGRITEALVGLVLALSAWLILNTINPDLINFKLVLP